MEIEGEPAKALALFEQAWAQRRDEYDASVAAHFVARHQPTPRATLEWNERALRHADQSRDARAAALMPSLCLNLADSYRLVARHDDAHALAHRGLQAIERLPAGGGYTQFVCSGLQRLLQRLDADAGARPKDT